MERSENRSVFSAVGLVAGLLLQLFLRELTYFNGELAIFVSSLSPYILKRENWRNHCAQYTRV